MVARSVGRRFGTVDRSTLLRIVAALALVVVIQCATFVLPGLGRRRLQLPGCATDGDPSDGQPVFEPWHAETIGAALRHLEAEQRARPSRVLQQLLQLATSPEGTESSSSRAVEAIATVVSQPQLWFDGVLCRRVRHTQLRLGLATSSASQHRASSSYGEEQQLLGDDTRVAERLSDEAEAAWTSPTLAAARSGLVQGALEGKVAPGTVVVWVLEPRGVHCPSRPASVRQATARITQEHGAGVLWVTWRPCVLDQATGAIANHEIVIPDPTDEATALAPLALPPLHRRTSCLSWRGAQYAAANHSMVGAFKFVVGTDVRFSIEQGVWPNDRANKLTHGRDDGYRTDCSIQLDVAGVASDSPFGLNTGTLAFKLRLGALVVHVTRPDGDDVYAEWFYPLLKHGQHLFVLEGSDERTVHGSQLRNRVVDAVVRIAALRWRQAPPRRGSIDVEHHSDSTPLQADPTAIPLHPLERVGLRAARFAETHLTAEARSAFAMRQLRGPAEALSQTRDWRLQPGDVPGLAGGAAEGQPGAVLSTPYRDGKTLASFPFPPPSVKLNDSVLTAAIASGDDVASGAAEVGQTLQNTGQLQRGWVVIAARGARRFLVVRSPTMFNVGPRLGARAAAIAIDEARHHPRGTMFVYRLEDTAFHCKPEGRAMAHKLNRRYPRLFWLTYNPCVLDPDTGRIGEREIPVPGFEAHESHLRAVRAARSMTTVLAKQSVVAWRGVSTGHFDNYRDSPRYRVVRAFGRAAAAGATGIDVAFSRLVQDVNESVVTPNMMGRYISNAEQAAEFRVLLDIDGNANAWEGLRWKLFAGSAVVKLSSPFVQWYYPQLLSGTHLIAVTSPQDAVRTALRLIHDPLAPSMRWLVKRLANESAVFAEKYLTPAAADKRLRTAIRTALVSSDPYKDWRIQASHRDNRRTEAAAGSGRGAAARSAFVQSHRSQQQHVDEPDSDYENEGSSDVERWRVTKRGSRAEGELVDTDSEARQHEDDAGSSSTDDGGTTVADDEEGPPTRAAARAHRRKRTEPSRAGQEASDHLDDDRAALPGEELEDVTEA